MVTGFRRIDDVQGVCGAVDHRRAQDSDVWISPGAEVDVFERRSIRRQYTSIEGVWRRGGEALFWCSRADPPPQEANPGGFAPPSPGGGSGRTIPTRSLRTSAAGGGEGFNAAVSLNPTPQTPTEIQRSPEETAALYEINRARYDKARQSGVNVPPLPPLSYPQK